MLIKSCLKLVNLTNKQRPYFPALLTAWNLVRVAGNTAARDKSKMKNCDKMRAVATGRRGRWQDSKQRLSFTSP